MMVGVVGMTPHPGWERVSAASQSHCLHRATLMEIKENNKIILVLYWRSDSLSLHCSGSEGTTVYVQCNAAVHVISVSDLKYFVKQHMPYL